MLKRAAIGAVKFYKKHISPHLPRACIYTPTCSEYCIEAIERFGVLKGGALTVKRILRCNPFMKGGLDPVPDRPRDKKWLI